MTLVLWIEVIRRFSTPVRAGTGDPDSPTGKRVIGEFARAGTAPKAQESPDALTEREREVLELMVSGITSNRKLAKHLGVSENTIKFHVRNILDKLRLHTRAEAVGYAIRHQIVDPTD